MIVVHNSAAGWEKKLSSGLKLSHACLVCKVSFLSKMYNLCKVSFAETKGVGETVYKVKDTWIVF